MLYVKGDRLVAQLIDKVSLPIPLQIRWIEVVERALQHRVRHRLDSVKCRRTKIADRLERGVKAIFGPGVTPDYSAHTLQVEMLWKRRHGRHCQECKDAIHILRRARDELAIPAYEVRGLVEGPERRPSDNGFNGM